VAGFDDPAFYGDCWAPVYDEYHAEMDPAPAVEFLAGLAGDRRVLELAIGTGRVALPLAARGIPVEGVDASEAMVARLRAKPGGAAIPVVIGDMAQVPATGPFGLVYLVFNSLFGLLSQDRQAECFSNVARARPGRDVCHRMLRPRPQPVRPGPARPGPDRDRRLSDSRAVPPRCGAAAHHQPDRHPGQAGRPPAAGGPALLLAQRAGPDGPAGGPAAPRTARRLGPAAIRLSERRPCLGLPARLTAPARPLGRPRRPSPRPPATRINISDSGRCGHSPKDGDV